MCALLFMCFPRHPLMSTFRKQILGQMKMPSSQCSVSDVTNFCAAGWTHCSSPCSWPTRQGRCSFLSLSWMEAWFNFGLELPWTAPEVSAVPTLKAQQVCTGARTQHISLLYISCSEQVECVIAKQKKTQSLQFNAAKHYHQFKLHP